MAMKQEGDNPDEQMGTKSSAGNNDSNKVLRREATSQPANPSYFSLQNDLFSESPINQQTHHLACSECANSAQV